MYLTDECVGRIRGDFTILDQSIHGHPLVYLDNAATTQMPNQVIDAVATHYRRDNANVHRGVHTLSERSTASFERARETVRRFINAERAEEVVFTGGTTDAINLVASSFSRRLTPDDAVVVTALEHHANFVPWQQACVKAGAKFVVIPIDEAGNVDLEVLENVLGHESVGMVATTHVSNVTGTVTPINDIVRLAHQHNALVLVDAAQSIRHEEIDVSGMDCDFLCFSGHKMLGPTGIGVLYGRYSALRMLDPVRYGGEMVDKVGVRETTFADLPLRFEAGTPNYVGAIALGSAIDYMESIGIDAIRERERALLAYAEDGLRSIDGLSVLGSPARRGGCLSFVVEFAHPFDIALLMDARGIALRSGNQCAQPLLHEVYGIQGVTRLSPAFYNTFPEIDSCIDVLRDTIALLRASA